MTTATPVYSIAKTFTAAAILESGIAPDATVGSLANVPSHLASLAVGDLLSHRSGLTDYGRWPDYHAAVDAREPAWPIDVVLDRATIDAPGTFQYSNIGYTLLRLALENRRETSFFEALQLDFPAHPFDWSFVDGDAPRDYDPAWVYTGTFVATADEVADGLARLLARDLGQRMLETWPVPVAGHPLDPAGYGFGLMTSGFPARFAGHGGGGPGFTLFALARADGSAAHAEVVRGEVDDRPLIEACLRALR